MAIISEWWTQRTFTAPSFSDARGATLTGSPTPSNKTTINQHLADHQSARNHPAPATLAPARSEGGLHSGPTPCPRNAVVALPAEASRLSASSASVFRTDVSLRRIVNRSILASHWPGVRREATRCSLGLAGAFRRRPPRQVCSGLSGLAIPPFEGIRITLMRVSHPAGIQKFARSGE